MYLRSRVIVCFLAAIAAQSEPPQAPQPAPKALRIGSVTVTGSLRLRGEAWGWFESPTGDSTYGYSGNIFRISLSQSRESWDWTAEFAAPFLTGLPTTATAPAPQGALGLGSNYFTANGGRRTTAMVFPKQLNVRLKGFGKGHSLKVGRFEFLDGSEVTPKNPTLGVIKNTRVNQRLLGNFGWAHVGRSFDGFHYSYSRGPGVVTLIGAVPTRGVFQIDGWGWNRVAFGYASYAGTWGAGRHAAESRVFTLFYDDFRKVLKTDNRPLNLRRADLANIKVETFGGHSVHAVSTSKGTADAMAWAAVQTGRWGAETHRGYAYDFEVGFQPATAKRLKPWFRGGYFTSSGDGSPSDGRHETFFQVMPTPRPFARFPFFNMMNNRDAFGMVTLRPHPKVTVAGEYHALGLSAREDLWYQGGGVFQPWTFGYAGRPTTGAKSLANLYDVSADYRVTPTITLTGYFAYAQGLAAISNVYPRGKQGALGYLEALWRF